MSNVGTTLFPRTMVYFSFNANLWRAHNVIATWILSIVRNESLFCHIIDI